MSARWHLTPMLIYKILRSNEWMDLQAAGKTKGAPVDLADGYIHFSTADQARATAAKWFAGEDALWLVACDLETMGDAIKWEPARGGDLFPHLYGELTTENIAWSKPLPLGDDGHDFPEDME